MPVDGNKSRKASPLHRMEVGLLPWISFIIVPIFGFANAGISFIGGTSDTFFNTISWGIILGLFFGKQLGIFLFTWVYVKLGFGKLPKQSTWLAQILVI